MERLSCQVRLLSITGAHRSELEIGDWRLEIGDWRSEIGDQRSETRDRRPEIGDQRSEIGDWRSVVGNRNLGACGGDFDEGQFVSMGRIRNHRDLVAWQEAMDLAMFVYDCTLNWPSEEKYGLVVQSRRSAVSIPSNIAEGNGRSTTKDYLRFVSIAHGSLMELDTQLIIANRRGYIDDDQMSQAEDKIAKVGRLIGGLTKSLKSKLKDQ